MEEKELKCFSNKTCEKLGAYVYKLIDPRNGKVFYIGKGRNNRVFDHVYNVEKYMKDLDNNNQEWQKDSYSEKIGTILEIKNEGLEVLYVIHRHGLTDEEAFQIESALIDEYFGLTNIQSGHDSDKGPMSAIQLERLYSLNRLKEFDKEDMVLIIKIKEDKDGVNNYYEQARKWWVLNLERAKKAKVAVVVIHGEIKCVIKINENSWKEMPGYSELYTGKKRYGFEGEIDRNSKYLHYLIPEKYMKKGNASPIQYGF